MHYLQLSGQTYPWQCSRSAAGSWTFKAPENYKNGKFVWPRVLDTKLGIAEICSEIWNLLQPETTLSAMKIALSIVMSTSALL
jgi:hypothetical protein